MTHLSTPTPAVPARRSKDPDSQQQAGMTCLPQEVPLLTGKVLRRHAALRTLLSSPLLPDLSVSILSAPGGLKPNQNACF